MQANHVATQLAQAAQIQAQLQAAAAAATSKAEVAQKVAAITSQSQLVSTPMIIPSQPVFPGPVAVNHPTLPLVEVVHPTSPRQPNGSQMIEDNTNGSYG